MHRYSLNIIIISFLSINSASFGMLKIDNIHKLPEELLRHIFVIAPPSTQNQLKISCKVWHEIGAKKAPNMYKLVDNESFQPAQDDWHYMMMHAALDKKIDVMVKILDRTEQRKFGYDLGNNRIFYLCCMPEIGKLLDDNWQKWKKEAPEKLLELDITVTVDQRVILCGSLFSAAFHGDFEWMKRAIKNTYKNASPFWPGMYHPAEEIDSALYMAVYNDNPYCIKLLSVLRRSRESSIKIPLAILELAIRKKKRKAFEALVKHNVYGCLKDVRLDYAYGGINTTILDELGKIKITDIPHINEYILSYAKSLVVKIL